MKVKHRKPVRKQKDEIPDWLKSIQLNSWEAELVVSALLLYALFQFPEWMDLYFRKVIQPGSLLRGFSKVMVDSIKLIRIGYLLHILIRGIWVATVGFSYVFPTGLSRKELKFKGKFDAELDNNEKLEGFVLTLEKLASVIYGLSFMLFGLYLGTFSLLLILAAVSEYGFIRPASNGNSYLPIFSSAFLLIYLTGLLILFLDFVTNGMLRRDRSSSKWFYYVARFYRIISFTILYRRSMLVIMSNLSIKWRRTLPFLVIAIIVSYWYIGRLSNDYKEEKYYNKPAFYVLSENYESMRDVDDLIVVTIPDQHIQTDVLEIFIKDLSLISTVYKKQKGIDIWKKWDDVDPVEKDQFLQLLIKINIDSNYFMTTKWIDGKNRFNFQQGFYGYLELEEIPDGLHHLNMHFNKAFIDSMSVKGYDTDQLRIANIPFYLNKP